ncbi:hypothetical protein GVAV_000143 [Gurleya vavrai]
MEKINEAKHNFDDFAITNDYNLIIFWRIDGSVIYCYKLTNLKFLKNHKIKESIISITTTKTLAVITSEKYVRAINLYSGDTERFLLIKNCKKAYILESNKLLVVCDNTLVLYSTYNQIESVYNYEKYDLVSDKVLIYFFEQITIFDSEFKVLNEIHIPNSNNNKICFTLYKNNIVYILNKKLIGLNYHLDLTRFFDETPDTFTINKNYVYLGYNSKMYFYDRKENKNSPLYLFAEVHPDEDGIIKRKMVRKINFTDKCELRFIEYDSFVQFHDVIIIKKGNKIYSFKEFHENCEVYINSDRSYDYIEGECDFDTSSELGKK